MRVLGISGSLRRGSFNTALLRHAGEPSELRVTREAARNLGLEIAYFQVRTDANFEPAFGEIARSDCDALVAFPDALMIFHRQAIGVFAKDANLPAMFAWS